jgi:hypothetical protein
MLEARLSVADERGSLGHACTPWNRCGQSSTGPPSC